MVDETMSNELNIPVRAMHLDLKGVPPTAERLLEMPRIASGLGFNALLVEWEDTFPWTVNENIRNETAYTREQVDAFHAAAAEHGVQIIPLVQCLGHMEFALKHAEYAHLREGPKHFDVLNPLAEGARELVAQLVRDVVAATPGVTHFHLGGDEAWALGKHPDTKAWIDAKGKGDLYMHHVEPILDELNAAGIRPMLWHDMMIDWDSEALTRLAAKADLVLWWYQRDPRETGGEHLSEAIIQRFEEHGITLWGGSAYKGADSPNVDVPDYRERELNALAWYDIAREHKLKGVIATAWSRYCHCRTQCEPIDAALDCLANHGAILATGQVPDGGRDACLAMLDAIGERETFDRCYPVTKELWEFRETAWAQVRDAGEMAHNHMSDETRWFGSVSYAEKIAQEFVDKSDDLTARMLAAYEGLIPRVWTERYLAERLGPIRDQAEMMLALAGKRRQMRSSHTDW
jgi:hexosaminidase